MIVDAVDEAIVNCIERITDPKTGAFERVYPKDVVEFLPFRLTVRPVRARMARLARAGAILRLGHWDGYVCHDRARVALEETLVRKLAMVERLECEISQIKQLLLQTKVKVA